jgi:hypothetical protein
VPGLRPSPAGDTHTLTAHRSHTAAHSRPHTRKFGGYRLYGSGKLEHWINSGMDLFEEYFPGSTQEWNDLCDANRKL